MDKITILLVDDHKLIRESWSFILNSDPRFQVIGETSNGEEAIDIAKEKRPKIILMDINMTPMTGFEGTKLIRKFSPGSKIIGYPCTQCQHMPERCCRLVLLAMLPKIHRKMS